MTHTACMVGMKDATYLKTGYSFVVNNHTAINMQLAYAPVYTQNTRATLIWWPTRRFWNNKL